MIKCERGATSMSDHSTKTIQLPEVLNQLSCADLQAQIIEWITDHPKDEALHLDVAKVERMGTIAVQLLLATSQRCKKSKINVRIEGATSYFIETVKDLGCYTQLQSQGLLP